MALLGAVHGAIRFEDRRAFPLPLDASPALHRRRAERGVEAADPQLQRLDYRRLAQCVETRYRISDGHCATTGPGDPVVAAFVEDHDAHRTRPPSRCARRSAPPVVPFTRTREAAPQDQRAVL